MPRTRTESETTVPKKPRSATRRAAKKASASWIFPTAMIERVAPELDGGRWPVKRVAGDVVKVEADIYKDGHDLLAARVCYRGPEDADWRHAPLHFDFNSDRWSGTFEVDRIGRWVFTVEAWTDWLGSWRTELKKKVDAGQEVGSELEEGAALIKRIAAVVKGSEGKQLKEAAGRLGDKDIHPEERVALALSDELAQWASSFVDEEGLTRYDRELRITVDRPLARFASWYEFFPRSQGHRIGLHGTFDDSRRQLRRLAGLGFDVIYLPPIHPIGHTNRKGPNNSLVAGPNDPGCPWAIGSEDGGHTAIEPRLGSLDDFRHFVDEARRLGMEVALDYALQCSPDHPWLKEHPDWFFVRPDGTLKYAENPPKKYQDIYPLNFWCEDRENLWNACRDIFFYWIEQGVRIFRVDNPHTKPLSFWEWCIDEVQTQHPDVIFFSEAFTRPKRMKGLAKLGFTQSYTYFTWRNTAAELREYMEELTQTEMAEYFRGNLFANTPDILHEYLQRGGRPAFRIRLLLAATLSSLYGIYSGFELCENVPLRPGSEEYLHSEKYEVRVRDWNGPGNINADVERINRIRREQPALQQYDNLAFFPSTNPALLCYLKRWPGADLLMVVNTDPAHVQEGMVDVPVADLGIRPFEPYAVEDLLTGVTYHWHGGRNYVKIDPSIEPGHVLLVRRTT